MKPRNFPERKNIRRKRVLLRFEREAEERELSKKEKREHKILTERVEPNRRDERSKKRRGDGKKKI